MATQDETFSLPMDFPLTQPDVEDDAPYAGGGGGGGGSSSSSSDDVFGEPEAVPTRTDSVVGDSDASSTADKEGEDDGVSSVVDSGSVRDRKRKRGQTHGRGRGRGRGRVPTTEGHMAKGEGTPQREKKDHQVLVRVDFNRANGTIDWSYDTTVLRAAKDSPNKSAAGVPNIVRINTRKTVADGCTINRSSYMHLNSNDACVIAAVLVKVGDEPVFRLFAGKDFNGAYAWLRDQRDELNASLPEDKKIRLYKQLEAAALFETQHRVAWGIFADECPWTICLWYRPAIVVADAAADAAAEELADEDEGITDDLVIKPNPNFKDDDADA